MHSTREIELSAEHEESNPFRPLSKKINISFLIFHEKKIINGIVGGSLFQKLSLVSIEGVPKNVQVSFLYIFGIVFH